MTIFTQQGIEVKPDAMNLDPTMWDASWLSGDKADARLNRQYELMQRGLLHSAPYSIFATFWRRKDDPQGIHLNRQKLAQTLLELDGFIGKEFQGRNTAAILGVNINLWSAWCAKENLTPPAGMGFRFSQRRANGHLTSEVIEKSSGTLVDSEGDLWFHIKSDDAGICQQVFKRLHALLSEGPDACVEPRAFHQFTNARSAGANNVRGKVLGRRFTEGANNPADPITFSEHTLVGYEDLQHLGASFVLSQNCIINWEELHRLSETQIEDIIGRKSDDSILANRDTRSHIKSARSRDEKGDTHFILRLGLPFGTSTFVKDASLALQGSNSGDEEGIYFAGFARDLRILESVLDQMTGGRSGSLRDRLLQHMRSNLGGFFYVPSTADLGLPPTAPRSEDPARIKSRFPTVDWDRLDRHFNQTSPNGYMYYNSRDYLFRMGTQLRTPSEGFQPPSMRVLSLLANTFARWQDNWYFDRKQEEMGHLRDYLTRQFDATKADEVMALPVMERKGWSIKMMLRLYASDAYGFRGIREVNGRKVSGADTYRIHPQEIIVGGMENLSLSQGRYVMAYLTEEERMAGFFRTLSEASGVGHVVPDFGRALKVGLGGLYADAEARLKDVPAQSPSASFYRAVMLTLEGVRDWCFAYADLAGKMAAEMARGQAAERDNLLQIQQRMLKVSWSVPETFSEAVQLIFTLHCCLHLTGEPTALGRIDQLLISFYERDVKKGLLTEEQAQEVLDCLWIKLGEKVQQNRLFVEDHQPYGNLAIGGSSGPYPKGASTNQWVQQVTVGGTMADDGPDRPAYNVLTRLAIRSSGRLPLNAPCLSLRVRKDMPRELLHEAAQALLSGGAHPILINDDKLIPGLVDSGKGIGGEPSDPRSVQAIVGKRWNSSVSLRSARNYAADGCYEPQFPGENWFSLGGMSTLNPLECALNMGKTYANAGPSWYRGALISFTSPPPEEIKSFDTLLELYFKHFHWLFAKATDGQLNSYSGLADYCPAPLLSVLMDRCMESGRDIYDGGARYNIYAPCFTGLASTINSLYAIKKMVFEPETAITSLPELVECLLCNWGNKMVEPYISSLAGPVRVEARAARFRKLRELALALPKYGRGNPEVDELGNVVIQRVAEISVRVFREPVEPTRQKMINLARRFGTEEFPFGVQIQPGVGTFASFVEAGQPNGASADGRLLGETLPSDLSPSPSPGDRPPAAQLQSFIKTLDGFTGKGTDAMWDGAPTDLNIPEDFPVESLESALWAFAQGRGSNILTVTCASASTFADAPAQPEKYDLLRVRMGGWTEFFTAMFPDKQNQHQRRPQHMPDTRG
jgi:Dyp-type peroxidase family